MSKILRLVLFLTALTLSNAKDATFINTVLEQIQAWFSFHQDPCSVVQRNDLDCVLSGCAKKETKCVSCSTFTNQLECKHQINCAYMGGEEGGCTTCRAITEKDACIDSTYVWKEVDSTCITCHGIAREQFCNIGTNKLCIWNKLTEMCELTVQPVPFEERVPREELSP
mmetsp:Transcript_9565/g.11200  ORF Transcript_9565/g.11200 Transcript_9565/m.11200 type:complete len:169 (+) Transcript_9565:174-680(+)|eukprot:CAMPEP_0198264904 /NCGR_PEP_ID=MMETSP1447-20131203/18598_1 /TAXON_ID=420782 /ORGANISM="Chaetoceros dichaeta, Strain CCMP1751" /LENGTH=168 /DNA_ID=CAMNT_0043954051 /DNA_START=46 /DNA_END=552 /DNA_ORIENTATION=-